MPSSAHAVPSPRDRRQWLRLLSGACLAHVTASLGGRQAGFIDAPGMPALLPDRQTGGLVERYSGRIPRTSGTGSPSCREHFFAPTL